MGKAIGYLIVVAIGLFLLRSTGLFDGMFSRSNWDERDTFWQKTVTAETPTGSAKSDVEALVKRHGVSLNCFTSSLRPPVVQCRGDDPSSKGGTARHPVALQLNFTFHGESLAKFETSRHLLR